MDFMSLFPEPAAPSGPLFAMAPGARARDYGLRYYQQEAKEGAEAVLSRVRSALIVMATGLGKSRVLASIAGDWTDRDVLVLAHRDELIQQNARTLEHVTGESVEIEQAQQRASSRCRIVMGSIQSVRQEKRLRRLGQDRFGLVIVDEAHHAVARSYQDVLGWYETSKVLGVTATPDRADEKALGKIFTEVAYLMEIVAGVEAGYLVGFKAFQVPLGEIDLSGVETRSGDLAADQLDLVMVKAVEGLVKATLDMYPNHRGPVFLPGIKSAEFACQRFNALKPGCAAFIHAKTPEDERRELVRDVKNGRAQFLCNVGIATEGFDWPDANIIIGGRPTKSRSLYAQMAGRGTRVLPGVVDHIPGVEGAQARREAIAASAKPDCVLLDFVGNAGRHSLIGPEDLLGGSFTDDEVALAKKKTKTLGGDAMAALLAARKEILALAAAVKSKVAYSTKAFDPFSVWGIDRQSLNNDGFRFGYKPATDAQRRSLLGMGMAEADLNETSVHEAEKLLRTMRHRFAAGLATFKQMRAMKKFGLNPTQDITFSAASKTLDYLINSTRKNRDFRMAESLMHQRREPGEEG